MSSSEYTRSTPPVCLGVSLNWSIDILPRLEICGCPMQNDVLDPLMNELLPLARELVRRDARQHKR